MTAPKTDELMSEEGRALVTDREREIISGDADVSDNYEYKVKSTIRNRIRKRLADDVEFLDEHFPEAYEIVMREVCEAPRGFVGVDQIREELADTDLYIFDDRGTSRGVLLARRPKSKGRPPNVVSVGFDTSLDEWYTSLREYRNGAWEQVDSRSENKAGTPEEAVEHAIDLLSDTGEYDERD